MSGCDAAVAAHAAPSPPGRVDPLPSAAHTQPPRAPLPAPTDLAHMVRTNGGWVTDEIKGPFKGSAGTEGW